MMRVLPMPAGPQSRIATPRLDRADAWFDRWDKPGVLIGTMTPVVRSFVAIPAGIGRVPFGRFMVFALLGCAVFCFGLAAVGWAVGSNYDSVRRYLDYAVIAGVLVIAGLVVVEPLLEVVGRDFRAVDRDDLILRGKSRLPRGGPLHHARDREDAAGLLGADADPRLGRARGLPLLIVVNRMPPDESEQRVVLEDLRRVLKDTALRGIDDARVQIVGVADDHAVCRRVQIDDVARPG